MKLFSKVVSSQNVNRTLIVSYKSVKRALIVSYKSVKRAMIVNYKLVKRALAVMMLNSRNLSYFFMVTQRYVAKEKKILKYN